MPRTSVRAMGRRFERTRARVARTLRPRLRKPISGAALRKRFIAHYDRACECLERAAAAPRAGERCAFLRDVHAALLVCLEMRPGNHVLRGQAKACLEALQELQGQPPDEEAAADCPVLLERGWRP